MSTIIKTFKTFNIIIEKPLKLDREIIYLIANDSRIMFVTFKCPCGCKKDVFLPTTEDTEKHWTVSVIENSVVTIGQSVERECCKFHIIESRVVFF